MSETEAQRQPEWQTHYFATTPVHQLRSEQWRYIARDATNAAATDAIFIDRYIAIIDAFGIARCAVVRCNGAAACCGPTSRDRTGTMELAFDPASTTGLDRAGNELVQRFG